MGDKSKRKLDGYRLSKQKYERRYIANECRDFLKECKQKHKPKLISDEITLTTVIKLVRYYLRNYKKV